MNTAEWIIVGILSGTLFIFLLLGIILMIKTITMVSRAKKMIIMSQKAAEDTSNMVRTVVASASIGGLVKTFASMYNHKP